MKSLASVFIKAFLFFILLFTLPRIVEHYFFPVYIKGQIWPSLQHHITAGLISGGITAMLGTLVQFFYIRYWAKIINIPSESVNYGTNQYLEIKTEFPLLSVFQDLKDRMQQKNWKLVRQDADKGLLEFKVEHNWQIPTDRVTIQLEPESTQRTLVKVNSKKNSLMINFIDHAYSLRNVYLVKQAIR